jgi:hypothetical protein
MGFGNKKDVLAIPKVEDVIQKVQQCINDSWETHNGDIADPSIHDNTILRQMLDDWNNYGHHLYPSVTINDVTFRG